MARKRMFIEVKGKEHTWSFDFYGDVKYLDEWRADGLEINIIENVIPTWVVDCGLLKPWCFLQDVFNFKFRSAFGSLVAWIKPGDKK